MQTQFYLALFVAKVIFETRWRQLSSFTTLLLFQPGSQALRVQYNQQHIHHESFEAKLNFKQHFKYKMSVQ